MKDQLLIQRLSGKSINRTQRPIWFWVAAKIALALIICGLPGLLAQAATTAVITPQQTIYWAGVNTTNTLGTGSNLVTFTSADASTFNLSVTGLPTGAGYLLNTNIATNNIILGVTPVVTNVAAGIYSFNINGSGGSYPSYSTNVTLYVVPQWVQTNAGTTGNWSDGTKWSGGSAPSATDSVYIDHSTPGPWTNVVDSSRSIRDLVYLGNGDEGHSLAIPVDTVIASGATLSVLGTNGFYIGRKNDSSSSSPVYSFEGSGNATLLVSNAAANFTLADGDQNSTRWSTVNMQGLNNLSVYVNRFAVADINAANSSVDGQTLVNLFLAKTNLIKAVHTDNYSAPTFDTGISYLRDDQANNNGQSANAQFRLGYATTFYTDSFGVGLGNVNASGTPATTANTWAYRMVFAGANSASPTNSVVFRNTDGISRMTLLAIGVDTLTGHQWGANRGIMDLRGGTIDMLVNNIWLGQNRTNGNSDPSGFSDAGGLFFDNGTVDCNTLIAGNMKYTNNVSAVQGFVVVGTNGTLKVNSNLILGQTPTNVTGFEAQSGNVTGQLQINGGGTVLANKITVGQFGTNNIISVSSGGLLVVSNTIASSSVGLTTLSLDGAGLTFSVLSGVTNAYVTNLNTTANASKINIASAPSGQSTNVLIAYQTANQVPNIGIGTLPAGFNNMQIIVDNVAKTVSLVVSTNAPKNLTWRGGQNSQWDHASLNWTNAAAGVITHFTDGDNVTFDDTASITNITVAETVNPGQSGTGILVTNNLKQFIFNNIGAGSIGSCSLVKTGTNNLEIDCLTSVGAQLNAGVLTIDNGGVIANATTAFGTTLNDNALGTISGGVTCAGTLQNAGSIIGLVNLLTPASVVNSGTLGSSFSMQTNCFLNNSGSMTNIGSSTVPTNSTLINGGIIIGSTLTINAGGTFSDNAQDSAGGSAGSINIGTLIIGGTFYPGGIGVIATNKITDFGYFGGSLQSLGFPNGRVQLNPGSLTTLNVNLANVQPYTKILSQNQVFGPSSTSKTINGGTLLINNIGPIAFAAGQSFKMFGYYANDGNINTAGLNTTNSYPLIVPATPGPGLAWDLSQLYSSGTIGIINTSSIQITLTNNVTLVGGTNIVTELSWPSDYIGSGWLQQQITALTNGLSTNWSNVGASDYVNDIFLTNTLSPGAVFFRFVRP